jgi:DNA-binding IclR family transcriptional regulator
MRGRPPVTRQRVLTYLEKHPGCSIMQIVRGTGADRRHVQRMMRALEKMDAPIFAASPRLL